MSKELQNKSLKKGKFLFLFDIDGTLCEVKLEVQDSMVQLLKTLSEKKNIIFACVTCNDMKNVKKELKDSFSYFSFFYTENGVVTYNKNLNIIHQKS